MNSSPQARLCMTGLNSATISRAGCFQGTPWVSPGCHTFLTYFLQVLHVLFFSPYWLLFEVAFLYIPIKVFFVPTFSTQNPSTRDDDRSCLQVMPRAAVTTCDIGENNTDEWRVVEQRNGPCLGPWLHYWAASASSGAPVIRHNLGSYLLSHFKVGMLKASLIIHELTH